jgi:hypothetical protein
MEATESSEQKKSWRSVFKVHPAADIFPVMPPDELRELGKDIKMRGLEEPITLWAQDKNSEVYVLDGRNRLDAMELVGMGTFYQAKDGIYHIKIGNFVNFASNEERRYGSDGVDPYLFSISKNIRRRHLSKAEQADLIVKAIKLKEAEDRARLEKARKAAENPDLVKNTRSEKRVFPGGTKGGSTKDPSKQKAVEEAKKHGISKSTVEKAIAKDRGPILQRKQREPVTNFRKGPGPYKPTKFDASNVARKVISFLEREVENVSQKDFLELVAKLQEEMMAFFERHGIRVKGPTSHEALKQLSQDISKVLNA